ncbi:LapA family protein [Pedobacter frigoris]|uniref:LapA family protein n=1 Tax=Pedobacter frigoris TaxID=2571272 RepID=A0A4V5NZ05_9SPHI|nr:LapA family protein [Pedobacter frigoris]TKC06363.1 LapA family protein [Pedobacter frigoris]
MKTKTIFIIAFTALITIFLMINTDAVEFNFIFVKRDISKLLVVGICTFVGFILGYWAAKPKTTVSSYDMNDPQVSPEDRRNDLKRKNDLSDEDRDYIS